MQRAISRVGRRGGERNLEREKVDLIFAVEPTSVTIAVKRVTARISRSFSTPVATRSPLDLVESFANPGGRLTGVHNQGRRISLPSVLKS